MIRKQKRFGKEKPQFRSYYCGDCKQIKPCQLLAPPKCCACYYQNEQARAKEYSNQPQIYQHKAQERQKHDRQLLLLKNYQGCKACKSLEVDAYSLYENNQLVCWNCLIKKESQVSSPTSFLGQQKWYQKR